MISMTIRYNGGRKNKNQFEGLYYNTIKCHQCRQEGVTMLICAAVGVLLALQELNKEQERERERERERDRETDRESTKSFNRIICV